MPPGSTTSKLCHEGKVASFHQCDIAESASSVAQNGAPFQAHALPVNPMTSQAPDKGHHGFNDECRFRWLWPVKVNNLLWWASLLMFTGATAFNVSTIASCLLGDVPEDWTTIQEVTACALYQRYVALSLLCNFCLD